MVFVAEKMNRVSVLIMKEDMEGVLEEIARSGVLHLAKIEEIDRWAESLKDISVSTLSGEYNRRRRKINDLIEEVSPDDVGVPLVATGDISIIDLQKLDRDVGTIENTLEPLIARRRDLTQSSRGFEHRLRASCHRACP
jgi:vacuolar-type H+-ATPase subunit I/STV1